MKLMTLNTWGGRCGRDLLSSFLATYRQEVDVFCFQEIWNGDHCHLIGSLAAGKPFTLDGVITDGLSFLSESLPDFQLFFRPHFYDYGLATAVKRDLVIQTEGERYVYQQQGYIPPHEIGHHPRNIQYVTLELPGQALTVINFHGLWNGSGKGDSPDRMLQSQKILEFTNQLNHPYILGGDFNLLPETTSLRMLEQSGLRNLVTEYGITSTRTSLYAKEPKFADYVLVCDGIEVLGFKVLPEEVSDHCALLLDFEVAGNT